MNSYYLKLYDKNHQILDFPEIHVFNNLTYTHTLNGMENLSFTTPIAYCKKNNIELILGQHIELYKVVNGIETCIWWGVVGNPSNDAINVNVVCYGYIFLLSGRIFKNLFDNGWTRIYEDVKYGKLTTNLISFVNSVQATGITLGTLEDGDLKTTREINWNDDLKAKIDELIEECNYCWTIGIDRKFNFYATYGTDKSDYYEINDYNLVNTSLSVIDYSNLYNRIYAMNEYTDDNGENVRLSSVKENAESIKTYGLREKELVVNDLRIQATMDAYVQKELDLCSNPSISLTLEVKICDQFNIYDISVGDYIYLNCPNNLGMIKKIRILEYTVDLAKTTVTVTVGNTLYKDNTEYKKYKY